MVLRLDGSLVQFSAIVDTHVECLIYTSDLYS